MKPNYILKNSEGSHIAVYDNGNKSKRGLILVHGNSLGAFMFKHQFANKQLNTYRLISFDLPGHGNSENSLSPERGYTLKAFAEIIAFVVKEIAVDKVFFAGHSLGGHLLLEGYEILKPYAAGYILFGTPPMNKPPSFDRMFLPNEAGALIFREQLWDENIQLLASAYLKRGAATIRILSAQLTEPIIK